jgi:transposase
MPKRAAVLRCKEEDRKAVERLASSRTEEARLVERAKMIQGCLAGKPIKQIAQELGVRPNTVIDWRKRFMHDGVSGLGDRPRKGRPVEYGADFRNRVLRLLETPAPLGQAVWDGPAVAQALQVSPDAVWRLLRKEGICLSRQRSWCVSTDPQFVAKSADVIGLYLNPPEKALVICLDEKPGIQALERATGYVLTDNGKIVRAFKSTYKRHGTLNLFAALEIATGNVRGKISEKKRRLEFLEFMTELVADWPQDQEIHVILDNYCIHKRCEAWLAEHTNVFFHFTPTSASWLNMVEIWFSLLSRKALRGASFKNTLELRQAIENYIAAYGPQAKPFVWRKREVKGSQLKNTIVNLCN